MSAILISPYGHSLVINGNNYADVYGYESTVRALDNSTVTVQPTSSIPWLYGFDNSSINVYGGEISWMSLYNESTANIAGGDISWLKLYDNSESNISYIEDLSWLLVNDDAEVNIYGSEFSYLNGHLSGNWANGSSFSFSFWALEELDLRDGNIGNILPDNIKLHVASVPEPSSLALLVMGLISIVSRKRTNK